MFGKSKWKKRSNRQTFNIEKPEFEILSGSVALQVWKKKSKAGRSYQCLTMGRWTTNGKKFWLSKNLYPSDLEDALEVLYKYQEFQSQKHRIRH